MSELKRREREGPNREEGHPYLYIALGLGFAVATVLVIGTAEVLAAGLPFVIVAAALLGKGVSELRGQRRALPTPVNRERELLSAIRDSGGSITPTEAALETSLTVREADQMLSELAASGHLTVESRHGALFYALPGRSSPEIEG